MKIGSVLNVENRYLKVLIDVILLDVWDGVSWCIMRGNVGVEVGFGLG